MKKCIECEHFKRVCPPMEHYDSGQVKCTKHDLVKDYFSEQSLKKLTCIEEGET